jgi:hypothetical protein
VTVVPIADAAAPDMRAATSAALLQKAGKQQALEAAKPVRKTKKAASAQTGGLQGKQVDHKQRPEKKKLK